MISISEKIEKLSDEFGEKWHKQFPDGQTVAPYVNDDVPGVCFESGAQTAIPLVRAEILEMLKAAPLAFHSAEVWADWLEVKFKEMDEGEK